MLWRVQLIVIITFVNIAPSYSAGFHNLGKQYNYYRKQMNIYWQSDKRNTESVLESVIGDPVCTELSLGQQNL